MSFLLAVTIFIDPNPPALMTSVEWHNLVCHCVGKWYKNFNVVPFDKADIRFRVGDTQGNYGKTRFMYEISYPHFPSPGEMEVIISPICPKIYTTLLHEIGHTMGLKHRENSIMSTRVRPPDLTPLDLQTIREYHAMQTSH